LTIAGEERAADQHECARTSLGEACESGNDFAFIACVHRHNFLSDGSARLFHCAQLDDRFRKIWISQCGDDASPRNQLTQHLHTLGSKPVSEERQASQIPARPVKACDKA
jgi:hypothetical protein